MEWLSMAKQLRPRLTSPGAMQSVRYNSVKHTATGLSSGDILWSDKSHFSVWQSNGQVWVWRQLEEQYFSDCIVLLSGQFGGGKIMMGLFFRSWAQLLSSSEINSECYNIPQYFGQLHATNFVG